MLYNKGAMFGLDARIALAIFGALSVISGAALYSAIQDAKTTAYITSLQEVGKAWEQYYLDTGQNLRKRSSDSSNPLFYALENKYLVEDPSVTGWKGPYINYNVENYYLKDNTIGSIYMLTLTDENTWGETSGWGAGICSSSKNCFIWIHTATTDKSLVNALDNKIDGSIDGINGNLKWSNSAGIGNYSIYFKYTPIKNPHD